MGKQAELHPAPSVQGIPSVIDCDSAPGIVIHDDGTVENGYGGGPGITVIYADKYPSRLSKQLHVGLPGV